MWRSSFTTSYFSKLSTEPWGGIDRGTLILSEHSIVPVFQWAILTPSMMKKRNFKNIKYSSS